MDTTRYAVTPEKTDKPYNLKNEHDKPRKKKKAAVAPTASVELAGVVVPK